MKKSETEFIEQYEIFETPQLSFLDVTTTIGYSIAGQKIVFIKKAAKNIHFSTDLITNKELNNFPFIIEIIDQYIGEEIFAVSNFSEILPLKVFITQFSKNLDFLCILFNKLLLILTESKFLQCISEFLESDMIWIDKNFNIKICWITFLVKNHKFFNNKVYKSNLKNIDGIINLFNYNKKRLQKRVDIEYKNDNVSSVCLNAAENIFSCVSEQKDSNDGTIKYKERTYTYDRGSVKVCSTKKLCIENYKDFCKTITNQKVNYFGLKVLLLKCIFHEDDVNAKNIDVYISRLKKLFLEQSDSKFKDSEALKIIYNFIVYNNINSKPIEIVNDEYINFMDNFFYKLKITTLSEKKSYDVDNLKEKMVVENDGCLFKEKGFDMSDYNTKSYKKGRFFICQAIPNSHTKDKKQELEINKVFQIIEIQSKQIEMMYQTLKDYNKIDHLIDAQLKSLSLQANEMLNTLDKNQE